MKHINQITRRRNILSIVKRSELLEHLSSTYPWAYTLVDSIKEKAALEYNREHYVFLVQGESPRFMYISQKITEPSFNSDAFCVNPFKCADGYADAKLALYAVRAEIKLRRQLHDMEVDSGYGYLLDIEAQKVMLAECTVWDAVVVSDYLLSAGKRKPFSYTTAKQVIQHHAGQPVALILQDDHRTFIRVIGDSTTSAKVLGSFMSAAIPVYALIRNENAQSYGINASMLLNNHEFTPMHREDIARALCLTCDDLSVYWHEDNVGYTSVAHFYVPPNIT